MEITMLGTGNALATRCYNTCFVLTDPLQPTGRHRLLVDGGGGNGILRQLERARIDVRDIHEVFVTHRHMDHLLGVLWVARAICQAMLDGTYEGDATVYGHDEVVSLLDELLGTLLPGRQTDLVGTRVHLREVRDGESLAVMGHDTTFFDIRSTKAKQFGFRMELEREGYDRPRHLACCGDEPFSEHDRPYVEGATLLMHEAFCLPEDADRLRPYEKHHSTVADAAACAEALGVRSLLLYHTEDGDLAHRKPRYAIEAGRYFGGMVYVPDDLETIEV